MEMPAIVKHSQATAPSKRLPICVILGRTRVRADTKCDRGEPGDRRLPRISLRCTDLPPVPAARQLGLAADSDRPQAEAAKARSGPERVLPSYSPVGGRGRASPVWVRRRRLMVEVTLLSGPGESQ
jgi:hypothetical protein